jgi:hypothetical protein
VALAFALFGSRDVARRPVGYILVFAKLGDQLGKRGFRGTGAGPA